jgi:hypothetical protein
MTDEAKKYLTLAMVVLAALAAIVYFPPFKTPFTFEQPPFIAWFGWVTFLFFGVSFIYTLRKREMLQTAGRLIIWKMAHIITGWLFVIFWLIHANGQPGEGLQFLISLAASGIAVTGLLGVFRQGYIPRIMTESLLDPVYKDELQDNVDQLLDEIDHLLHGSTESFHEVYQRHILPFAVIDHPSAEHQTSMLQRCFGPDDIDPNAAIEDVKHLDDGEVDLFFEVAEKVVDIIEIRRSQSYQQEMNNWIYWHVGLSLLLMIFVFFHVFTVFYF